MESQQSPHVQGLTADDIHYSQVLCELWAKYLRFLQVGMAASGVTILAIGQYLSVEATANINVAFYVKSSIFLAGLAGISFSLCRWLSQIIMERQVYGPRSAADLYFSRTETRPPNALRYSAKVLAGFYKVNELFKFIGAATLLLSWVGIVYVLFVQVDIRVGI